MLSNNSSHSSNHSRTLKDSIHSTAVIAAAGPVVTSNMVVVRIGTSTEA